MKKILVLLAIMAVFAFFGLRFVQSGGFEKYMDSHPNEWLNPRVGYYLALSLGFSGRAEPAKYRFRKVAEKYPDSEYAPLSRMALINMMDAGADRSAVLDECRKFLEEYPAHPKADIIRNKIIYLQGNH